MRDPTNGQFTFDKRFDRMCRCGHTLGDHVDGGFDCIVNDLSPDKADRCDCARFRPATHGDAALRSGQASTSGGEVGK